MKKVEEKDLEVGKEYYLTASTNKVTTGSFMRMDSGLLYFKIIRNGGKFGTDGEGITSFLREDYKYREVENQNPTQSDLMEIIREKADINIVTCGNCSSVILHERHVEEIKCYDCGYEGEPCDFPDLFHDGWDNYLKESKWEYTVSSESIWSSFDFGEVQARTEGEAMEKALTKLRYNFEKVNQVLASADVTKNFTVEFSEKDIRLTKKV